MKMNNLKNREWKTLSGSPNGLTIDNLQILIEINAAGRRQH
jgi:hypothetical protein